MKTLFTKNFSLSVKGDGDEVISTSPYALAPGFWGHTWDSAPLPRI